MLLIPHTPMYTAVLLVSLISATRAEAGWITVKNDTSKAIIIQEYAVVNGRKICGKPYKLLPGESFREFQNTPGIKNFEVLDAANVNNTLLRCALPCNDNTQTFSMLVVRGKVGVVQLPEPKKP